MLSSEILITEIPPLNKSDSVAQAIEWMDEFKVTHLAVTQGAQYLGLVSEDFLLNIDDPTDDIGKYLNQFIKTSVYENDHVFEVVKLVEKFKLSLIPILSVKDLFLGVTTTYGLMQAIAEMPVVKNPGGVIVMDMVESDYSMTEIARIVESNDAKILGSFITRNHGENKFELTLKINKTNVQDIIQTFERFEYEITASYDQSNSEDDLLDRYNNLMNYLNI
jgi:CBS domain-containing protein